MQILHIIVFTLFSIYSVEAAYWQYQNSNQDGYTTLAYFPVIIRQAKPTGSPVQAPAAPIAAQIRTETKTVTAPPVTFTETSTQIQVQVQTQTETQTQIQTQTQTQTETQTVTAPETLRTAFDNANAWCQQYNGPSSNGILDGNGNHLACTPMKPGCP